MTVNNKQLKDFIVDSGLVPRADLDSAWKSAHREEQYLGDVLVASGKLSEDELRRTEAYLLGIPYVNLKDREIDFEVLSIIPEPIARKHSIVAFKKTDGGVEVAMLDLNNIIEIDFIKLKLGIKFLPRLSDSTSLNNALLQYQKNLKENFGDIIEKEAGYLKKLIRNNENEESESIRGLAQETSVKKIVDTLLHHAVLQGASDIHIEPTDSRAIVRYRINGVVHDAMFLSRDTALGILARIKMLAGLDLSEQQMPQSGHFTIENEQEKTAFQVSILPTYYGEKIVVSVLGGLVNNVTLESLGLHSLALERVHKVLKQRSGMILVVGEASSGISTTLYTLLNILNRPDVNISTIENPINYHMARVNQTQVNIDIGLTFARGLRALMSQDPDVIMVSELEDHNTSALAISAVMRGHLILSAVNADSASRGVSKLLETEIDPVLVSSTVNVVIAQRLVRRLSGSDGKKEKYFLSGDEIEILGKSVDLDRVLNVLREENIVEHNRGWRDIPFYRPQKNIGSDDGYDGHVALFEVLKITPVIRELITKGVTPAEIEAQAKVEGMVTMLEDGIIKAVQGMTTIEEVINQLKVES